MEFFHASHYWLKPLIWINLNYLSHHLLRKHWNFFLYFLICPSTHYLSCKHFFFFKSQSTTKNYTYCWISVLLMFPAFFILLSCNVAVLFSQLHPRCLYCLITCFDVYQKITIKLLDSSSFLIFASLSQK